MATILTPSNERIPLVGTKPVQGLKKDKKHPVSLEQMQKAVDGYVERVFNPNGDKCICIVNEEGQFREDLPINQPARELIAKEWGVPSDEIVPIRGNVVILDDTNPDAEWY
jgi:hypothetical protein